MGGFENATKIPELRKRVIFTFVMLIIYRVGVFVPTPGIDADRLARLFEQASATLFGMVNMFSGGALENFSVFALGIMPYITMSIIIQLLTSVVPRLEELQKEGEQGRRIITRYTRIGTICLALFQGTIISIGLESQGVVMNPGLWFRVETAITLSAGTAFIMWLGEQISERGIGNGISLIIMAGIVARMPTTILQTLDLAASQEINPMSTLGIFLFGILTIAVIVYVERAQRRIPVQYPKRAVGGKRVAQGSSQHLPLKINMAGVIPPIFASVFLAFPLTIAQFWQNEKIDDFIAWFNPNTLLYNVVFSGLIIFLCYFYTALMFDPNKVADNLKRNGGFVPTVRPGKDTASFLSRVLDRLTLWGAFYICAICILPRIFYTQMGASSFSYFFGGTAVLIVVGVTLDTLSQIESHMVARNYEGFMSKSPGKIRGGAGRVSNMRGRLIQR